jgi:hypothetical protein
LIKKNDNNLQKYISYLNEKNFYMMKN